MIKLSIKRKGNDTPIVTSTAKLSTVSALFNASNNIITTNTQLPPGVYIMVIEETKETKDDKDTKILRTIKDIKDSKNAQVNKPSNSK